MNQKPYIIEKVYVETPVDTDGDGKKDLIAVYLRLPKEVEEGKKVPAIYVANPYMLTCNEDWYVPYNVDCEVKAFPAQDIKEEDICFDYEAYEKKIKFVIRISVYHQYGSTDRVWRLRKSRREESI